MNRISEKINRVVRSLGTPPELEMSDKEIEQSYQGYKIEDFSWKSQDSGGFRIEFPQETAEGDEGWYDNFLYYSDGSIGFKHWYPEGMYRELVEFVESRDDRPIEETGTKHAADMPTAHDIADVLLTSAVADEIEERNEDVGSWAGTELTGWMGENVPDWKKLVQQFYSENSAEIDEALGVIQEDENKDWVEYVVNHYDSSSKLGNRAYELAGEIVDREWPESVPEEDKEGFIKRTPGKERY